MAQLSPYIQICIGIVIAILGFLARDYFSFRSSRGFVSPHECERCQESMRDELAAGDKEFAKIRKAIIAVLLVMIPLCEELLGKKANCHDLHNIIKELAD